MVSYWTIKDSIKLILVVVMPLLYDVFWFGTLFTWMIPRLSVGFVQILAAWTAWDYIATALFFTLGLFGAFWATLTLAVLIGAVVLGD